MNTRAIGRYIGLTLKMEALFMLLPLFISAFVGAAHAVKGFAITIVIMLFIAYMLDFSQRKKDSGSIHFKEGFVLVAVCWIFLCIFGALPFWFSGEIPKFTDAIFESVSGFTTTGSTILEDIEVMSKGMLFWRSFSHWVGGMGVLVFLIAVMPFVAGERNLNVMKAESPGPAPGKMVPKLRRSAGLLYGIYFVMTLILVILLIVSGMPVFDSICHAMATAGTGGFSVKNQSIGAYDSISIEIILTVFMILFGVNFNIYYFLITRNFKSIWQSEELRAYLGIIAVSTLIMTVNIYGGTFETAGEALRNASFNVASIITTTGYALSDFSGWPELSKSIIFFLMLLGGSAGSTSGGIKVARALIMAKEARRKIYCMTHPRAVEVVKLDGHVMDKSVVHAVNTYFMTFCALSVISLMLVSLDDLDFDTTVTAVMTCIGNVGPGFSKVSPVGNFSEFSLMSKIVLIIDMLLGRLEIYPVLLLFAPQTWKKV